MTTEGGRVLVMTVGTGDLTRIEETLFVPLRKSITTDAWVRVILLPSDMTEEFAERLRNGMETVDAVIRPLPARAENDADRAYAHFDAVLSEVLRATPPHRVVVDFTRGTKAMSAAVVLAATRREVPYLRYITGRRDQRGMVQAGSEKVRQIRTTVAAGHRRLDLARDLMLRGNFPAAEAVMPAGSRAPVCRDLSARPDPCRWCRARGGSILRSLGSTRLCGGVQHRSPRGAHRRMEGSLAGIGRPRLGARAGTRD